jgi:hypothetical protein
MGDWVVVLDAGLDQTDRTAVLAHELEHIARGGGLPEPIPGMRWGAILAREEATVDRAAVDQLVPPAELDTWITARVADDSHVDAVAVSDAWAVPQRYAAIALDAATKRATARHPATPTERCETVTTPAGRRMHLTGIVGQITPATLALLDEIAENVKCSLCD